MSEKASVESSQRILKALLKRPENKHCADCKTSAHPRWASWSCGVFLCIRCSGIHRSMGTHISRVKSVDLDGWTAEQIKSMEDWGNVKANLYYEAKLTSGYTPVESKIENFIRTKYELKKWILDIQKPDPALLNEDYVAACLQRAKETAKPATGGGLMSFSKNQELKSSATISVSDDLLASGSKPSFTAKPKAVDTVDNHKPPATIVKPAAEKVDLKSSILSLYAKSSASVEASNTSTPLSLHTTPLVPQVSTSTDFKNDTMKSTFADTSLSWNTDSEPAASVVTNDLTDILQSSNQVSKLSIDSDLFNNVWK